jgi:hypothetical protein
MKTGKLKRIGSMIPLVGTMVLSLGGMAHASLIGLVCDFAPILCKDGPIRHPQYTGAPELDVGMAVSGLTMLAASILVIVERRRRR